MIKRLVVAAVMSASAQALAGDSDCDKSDRAAGRLVTELGRLSARDDANNTDYKFVVCETYNVFEQSAKVTIDSSVLTGTVLTQKTAESNVSAAKECQALGAPYSASSANDKRFVEYRLCQKDGKPDHLQVEARTLDKSGAVRPPKILTVPWPNMKAVPTKLTPMATISHSAKLITCDNDETTLGKLEADDEINDTKYAFVICENKEKTVNVRSNFLTGTVWSAAEVASAAAQSGCLPHGAPYGVQGPGDARRITYQICGTGQAPAHVEVQAVTLDKNWQAKPAKKVSAAVK
jgi:hypothetical protein